MKKLLVCFLSRFSFAGFLIMAHLGNAWENFTSELNTFLLDYSGVNDQYIKGCEVPQGYFVPIEKNYVGQKWYSLKEVVRDSIGNIEPKPDADSAFWQNSADSVNSLFDDASAFVNYFIHKIVLAVEAMVPGSGNTGFQFVQKTKKSIQSKVNRDLADGIKNPIKWIGDALRATIVVDTVQQHQEVISNLTKIIKDQGQGIVYKNIYDESYSSGYVGIHAKLRLQDQSRFILAELQIHFRNINDGTLQCPKEYCHSAYEVERAFKSSGCQFDEAAETIVQQLIDNANSAMKIVYLFGLERINNDNNTALVSTIPNNCIVNDTSNHFVKGFLLKAIYDNNDNIVAIQLFEPSNNSWNDCCGSNKTDKAKFGTYLAWIQNEDGDENICGSEDYEGDDSICINETEANRIAEILISDIQSNLGMWLGIGLGGGGGLAVITAAGIYFYYHYHHAEYENVN